MFHAARRSWPVLALAVLSACLVRLSFPPFDWAGLMLLAWVPLLLAVSSARPKVALMLGLTQGVCFGLLAHPWVISALRDNFGAPIWGASLALAAIALLCGIRAALMTLGLSFLRSRRVPLWLSFPPLQVCSEQLIPGFFPFSNALAAHSVPAWQQLAAFGGASAISAWLNIVNGLGAAAILAWLARDREQSNGRRAVRFLVAALLVTMSATSLGHLLIRRETARATQAPRKRLGIGHYVSADPLSEAAPTLRDLSLREQQRVGKIDLVVWPEAVLTAPIPLADVAQIARDFLLHDRRLGVSAPALASPLLFGAVVQDRGELENAALLIRPDGAVVGRYAKRVLIPVGESAELLPGLPFSSIRPATPFRSGPPLGPLMLDGHALGTSICYEDIVPDFVRREVLRTAPELLLNLTSDRWFRGTSAVDFHFALAKLRAVEHRKYLVRATEDGISGVVDSSGRVLLRSEGSRSEVLSLEVPMLPGLSGYARYAGWWKAASFTAGLALLIYAARRRTPG